MYTYNSFLAIQRYKFESKKCCGCGKRKSRE